MLDRRQLLASTAATAAAFALPRFAFADTANPMAAKLNGLMDTFFQENLRENPETATILGLDKGANADLKGKLSDESAAGIAAHKALNDSQLNRLKALDANALTGMDRVNYDTLVYVSDSRARVAAFDFGGNAFGPSPYPVSQLTGVYQSVPDFLDTKHSIESAADADAYISRLEAFAVQIDNNTDRMKHDAGLGISPPDFILDRALEQLAALRVDPDKSLLVTSIARRAKEKGLPDSYAANAAKLYSDKIAPALDRQIAEAKTLRAGATHDAGLWKIKDGEAFYAAALHFSTTTNMSAEEIHKMGLEQGKEISARIDGILKKQGMTKGTVGERIAALYKDPSQIYPNTDAGKAEAIAFCDHQLNAIKPKLPTVFNRVPPYSFEVRRVPVQTEAGAASAFSQTPSLDGSRPGIVYINLHDTAEWPRFSLSSVIFHEGLPGHQMEGGLALSNKALPLIRKTIYFSGYGEGWALYAEQLADEIGMYDGDPLSRIGYLKFMLFRANRCVADTGIHHMKWSRERAIQQFVDGEGEAPGFAAREVERYCVSPGQACSYKIGHTVWTRARERTKQALGAKYSIKDFHDAGLNCGRVPLDVLDGVIDRYIATAKA
ncbi:MAG TPA: DUF885 family protein [Rhizomicrobium sp.]|nr:DUF885 family protein [Rhizomicrobium sp.]